jgi:lysophospholipase L1-like esterase
VKFSRIVFLLLAPAAGACGGGGSGPVGPTPPPGTPVNGFVFYDENGNGTAEPSETVRFPAVTVAVGGRTAESTAGGRVTVADVPAGAQAATLRPESLPAYYAPGAAVSVTVPQPAGSDLAIPATLAVGGNRAQVYIAFGDSISYGDGSNDGSGYRTYLEANIRSYWGGSPRVLNEGEPATRSLRGEQRIDQVLNRTRPAYTLILYGTNDWNDAECRNSPPCYTIDALRSMVLQARGASSFPILGTIPPVNPAYIDRDAEARNAWVRDMNERLEAMAAPLRVPVADIHDAFTRQPSLPALFTDFLHPNEQGYSLMAQTWFQAITRPGPTGTSAASSPVFGFVR